MQIWALSKARHIPPITQCGYQHKIYLHICEQRMLIGSIHLHLLSKFKVGYKPSTGSHIFQTIQDLCPIVPLLLLYKTKKYHSLVVLIIFTTSSYYVYLAYSHIFLYVSILLTPWHLMNPIQF